MVFRGIGTQKVIIFGEDNQGRISYLYDSDTPQTAFVKLSLHETPVFHCTVLGVCVLIFLSVLNRRTRLFSINRRRRVVLPDAILPRLARYAILVISMLNTLSVSFLFIQLSMSEEIAFGVPWLVYVGLTVAIVSVVVTGSMLVITTVMLGKDYLNRRGRIHYILVTVAALAFVCQFP